MQLYSYVRHIALAYVHVTQVTVTVLHFWGTNFLVHPTAVVSTLSNHHLQCWEWEWQVTNSRKVHISQMLSEMSIIPTSNKAGRIYERYSASHLS